MTAFFTLKQKNITKKRVWVCDKVILSVPNEIEEMLTVYCDICGLREK